MDVTKEILRVENLKTYVKSPIGEEEIPIIDDISFSVREGEILGVIGESGSGKSVTALSIMQLLNKGKTRISKDSKIYFKSKNMLEMKREQVRKMRGKEMSMIFQDPLSSLNPVYTIRKQIGEVLKIHRGFKEKEIDKEIINILNLVGISAPEQRLKQYPHELSGGMRQRVMIAMGLACQPELLIADEPTTALDVTIQAQILELIKDLRNQLNVAIILITHDMGVIADMTDKVAVMYSGKIVEYGTLNEIFYSPKHPYTKGLLNSIPRINQRVKRLNSIEGVVPTPKDRPKGCNYQNRCPFAMNVCVNNEPEEVYVTEDQKVSCWLYGEELSEVESKPLVKEVR